MSEMAWAMFGGLCVAFVFGLLVLVWALCAAAAKADEERGLR